MSVRFIQLSDPQIGMFSELSAMDEDPMREERMREWRRFGFFPGDQEPNPLPRNCPTIEPDVERFTAAIEAANGLEPAFVMISGDLVNDPESEEQHDAFRAVASGLDASVPLHCVPGNHDISPDRLSPTPELLAEYRRRYGDDYYAFVVQDTLLIALNSELISRPEHLPDEARRQYDFIEAELSSRRAREADQIIAFMHTPLFIRDPASDRAGVIEPEGRHRALSLLSQGGVRLALAGHLHHNIEAKDGELAMVTSGAVGFPFAGESGYRVVDVHQEGIRHEYRSLVFTR